MSSENSQATFLGGLRRGEMAADHFTIVSNLVARDQNISYRAKGLFLNMASHRADFTITEDFLASMGTEGVKAIRAALGELREAGYIYRGQRQRYPQGARNAKGKDISGALGPYEWYVTDQPDEIAAILTKRNAERADGITESAGQDKEPKRPPVMNCGDTGSPQAELSTSLGAKTAASDDLRKHPGTAGHHKLPKPPVGFGSSIEDHSQKTHEKDHPPAASAEAQTAREDAATDGWMDAPQGENHEPASLGARLLVDAGVVGAAVAQWEPTVNAAIDVLGVPGVRQQFTEGMGGVKNPAAVVVTRRLPKLAKQVQHHQEVEANRVHAGPVCGQCDARDGDPIATRTVEDATGRPARCPRCHPYAVPVAA